MRSDARALDCSRTTARLRPSDYLRACAWRTFVNLAPKNRRLLYSLNFPPVGRNIHQIEVVWKQPTVKRANLPVAWAVVACVLIASSASASQTADLRTYEVIQALKSGPYAAATAHFDPTMKSGFSAERIGTIWQGLVAADGKLNFWQITKPSSHDCQETMIATLEFERNSVAAFISVNLSGEVSRLYPRAREACSFWARTRCGGDRGRTAAHSGKELYVA
jgi:hypothetical protein